MFLEREAANGAISEAVHRRLLADLSGGTPATGAAPGVVGLLPPPSRHCPRPRPRRHLLPRRGPPRRRRPLPLPPPPARPPAPTAGSPHAPVAFAVDTAGPAPSAATARLARCDRTTSPPGQPIEGHRRAGDPRSGVRRRGPRPRRRPGLRRLRVRRRRRGLATARRGRHRRGAVRDGGVPAAQGSAVRRRRARAARRSRHPDPPGRLVRRRHPVPPGPHRPCARPRAGPADARRRRRASPSPPAAGRTRPLRFLVAPMLWWAAAAAGLAFDHLRGRGA